MAEIGDPIRVIEITPSEDPVPMVVPETFPAPVEVPDEVSA